MSTKAKRIEFAVYIDENKIFKDSGINNLLSVINMVGPEKIESLGIRGTNGNNLIVRNPDHATKPINLGCGFFLNSQTSSYEKIADIFLIRDSLKKDWAIFVEKTDKSVDEQIAEYKSSSRIGGE